MTFDEKMQSENQEIHGKIAVLSFLFPTLRHIPQLCLIESRPLKNGHKHMSLLFVIWNNDIGRGIIEAKGLIPDVLKEHFHHNCLWVHKLYICPVNAV